MPIQIDLDNTARQQFQKFKSHTAARTICRHDSLEKPCMRNLEDIQPASDKTLEPKGHEP